MKQIHSLNKVQSIGRTMVEMLAVLSISALIVSGIIGSVRYILDKNTANQILKEALTQASEIKLRRKQYLKNDGEIRYAYDSEYITSRKYGKDKKGNDDGTLIFKVENVSKGVCKKLVSKEGVSIFSSIHVDTTNEDKDCQETNVLAFITDTTTLASDSVDACANENCCGHGKCDPQTGLCSCDEGWEGNRCCTPDCPVPDKSQATCRTMDELPDVVDDRGCNVREYVRIPCLSGEYCHEDNVTCCPVVENCKEYSSKKEICQCDNCQEGYSLTIEGQCCPENRYSKARRECCPEGEFITRMDSCCPEELYASQTQECCVAGLIVSKGYCCPEGETYYSGVGCCASSKYAAILAHLFGSPGRITYLPTSPSLQWM